MQRAYDDAQKWLESAKHLLAAYGALPRNEERDLILHALEEYKRLKGRADKLAREFANDPQSAHGD